MARKPKAQTVTEAPVTEAPVTEAPAPVTEAPAPVTEAPAIGHNGAPDAGEPSPAQLDAMGRCARNLRQAKDMLRHLLMQPAGATPAMRDMFKAVYIGAYIRPDADQQTQLELGRAVLAKAGGDRSAEETKWCNNAKQAWSVGLKSAEIAAVDNRGGDTSKARAEAEAAKKAEAEAAATLAATKADTPKPAAQPAAPKPAAQPEAPKDVTPAATTPKHLVQIIRANAQALAALMDKNSAVCTKDNAAYTEATRAYVAAIAALAKG